MPPSGKDLRCLWYTHSRVPVVFVDKQNNCTHICCILKIFNGVSFKVSEGIYHQPSDLLINMARRYKHHLCYVVSMEFHTQKILRGWYSRWILSLLTIQDTKNSSKTNAKGGCFQRSHKRLGSRMCSWISHPKTGTYRALHLRQRDRVMLQFKFSSYF